MTHSTPPVALAERPAPPTIDAAPRPRAVPHRTSGRWIAVAVGAALAVVFVARWHAGWLLLLDWSPGPAARASTGPELPVGIALRSLVGLLAEVDPRLVGWVPPSMAVVAAYAGGLAVARCRPGPGGRTVGWAAATVGGCVAVANPFVASRLYAGQIGVLWGYAALLFLVASVARSLRSTGHRAWLRPALWWAAASAATVHLVVIGVVPVVVGGLIAHRRVGWRAAGRRLTATVLVASGITAAWLVPDIAARGELLGTAGGREAVITFASGGPFVTLWLRALGGAAFWRPLPPGSLTFVGVAIALAWLATALVSRHGQGHARDARHLLGACAAVAAVAVYVSHGPFVAVWSRLTVGFWPAGLLREPGKLAMLALAAPVAGAAAAAQRWADRGDRGPTRRRLRAGTVPALVAAPVALVGLVLITGLLAPSRFPHEWARARAAVAADSCRIAVIGDGAYVDPGFTGGRVVANPAREYFGPRAIVSDDPGVTGLEPRPPQAAAERWAARVNARYIGDGGPTPSTAGAAAVGIGWVLVDRPVDHAGVAADLGHAGFQPVVDTDRAGLWRVPGGCS